MVILSIDKVSFTAEDLVASAKKTGRRRSSSADMQECATKAYDEGAKLLSLRASVEFYDIGDIESGDENINLFTKCTVEPVYIGQSIGYLFPAKTVAVALCTAGRSLVSAMDMYANNGEYLLMYYLDAFGVRALGEMSQKVREYVTAAAIEKGWGVGPQMQPGSVAGWEVSGQRDLFRLAHGEQLGLSLNESCFLIPRISDSLLIGIGPHYDKKQVGSLCSECPRFKECLWRKENITN